MTVNEVQVRSQYHNNCVTMSQTKLFPQPADAFQWRNLREVQYHVFFNLIKMFSLTGSPWSPWAPADPPDPGAPGAPGVPWDKDRRGERDKDGVEVTDGSVSLCFRAIWQTKTMLRIIDLQWVQEVLVVPVVQYYPVDPKRRRWTLTALNSCTFITVCWKLFCTISF